MPRTRMLEGKLIQKEDATDDCWTNPQAFMQLLIQKMGLSFPVNLGNDFVVYGFQTPTEDDKGKLWVRTDRAGHYAGDFLFVGGKWPRVYNYSIHDVVWKTGDSREIEPGFQLIDGSVASIPVDTQTHIIGFYQTDIVNSTPLLTVYKYFATIYLGV